MTEAPGLEQRIREEIAGSGPMTFARFMELALYDPVDGYYATRADRPTRSGDYLSAPELHPIFGHTLALQLIEMWERLGRPGDFAVVEHGAGAGTLMLTVMEGLALAGSPLHRTIRFQPIEVGRVRLAQLVDRWTAEGLGDRIVPPSGGRVTGVVLANELLDALPVHRVVGRGGVLRELFVGADEEGLVWLEGPASTPTLAGRLSSLDVTLEDGQEAEICLAIDGWAAEVAAGLERGYVLVLDYGYPALELYAPSRRRGTVMAYRGHTALDDPLAEPGLRDITAHVDFTTLARALEQGDLVTHGLVRQSEFLLGAGLEELFTARRDDPATELGEYLELRSSVVRLLDPRALGGFRVLVASRGAPTEPPLRGLARARVERP